MKSTIHTGDVVTIRMQDRHGTYSVHIGDGANYAEREAAVIENGHAVYSRPDGYKDTFAFIGQWASDAMMMIDRAIGTDFGPGVVEGEDARHIVETTRVAFKQHFDLKELI